MLSRTRVRQGERAGEAGPDPRKRRHWMRSAFDAGRPPRDPHAARPHAAGNDGGSPWREAMGVGGGGPPLPPPRRGRARAARRALPSSPLPPCIAPVRDRCPRPRHAPRGVLPLFPRRGGEVGRGGEEGGRLARGRWRGAGEGMAGAGELWGQTMGGGEVEACTVMASGLDAQRFRLDVFLVQKRASPSHVTFACGCA
jgi:hypothetical protein